MTAELFRNGVLIAGTLNSAMTSRIEPPIVITYEQIDQGIDALKKALKTVHESLNISVTSHLDALAEIPKKTFESNKDPLKKLKKNLTKK